MTIRMNDNRRPIGYYTWVAYFRDNSLLQEFYSVQDANTLEWTDYPQNSFEMVSNNPNVFQVHLIPVDNLRPYICIQVAEGERVVKKATRTFTQNLEDGVLVEHPPIDCFMLISDKPVWNYSYLDGSTVITTNPEP